MLCANNMTKWKAPKFIKSTSRLVIHFSNSRHPASCASWILVGWNGDCVRFVGRIVVFGCWWWCVCSMGNHTCGIWRNMVDGWLTKSNILICFVGSGGLFGWGGGVRDDSFFPRNDESNGECYLGSKLLPDLVRHQRATGLQYRPPPPLFTSQNLRFSFLRKHVAANDNIVNEIHHGKPSIVPQINANNKLTLMTNVLSLSWQLACVTDGLIVNIVIKQHHFCISIFQFECCLSETYVHGRTHTHNKPLQLR